MTPSTALWTVAVSDFLLNLPFGFWRAGVPRFSARWFLAVHAPVPLLVGIRWVAGVELSVRILPLLLGVYAAGQFLGGRIRRRRDHCGDSRDEIPDSGEGGAAGRKG